MANIIDVKFEGKDVRITAMNQEGVMFIEDHKDQKPSDFEIKAGLINTCISVAQISKT